MIDCVSMGPQWIILGTSLAASPPDVRKVSDLPKATELVLGLRPLFEMNKFQISRDLQVRGQLHSFESGACGIGERAIITAGPAPQLCSDVPRGLIAYCRD